MATTTRTRNHIERNDEASGLWMVLAILALIAAASAVYAIIYNIYSQDLDTPTNTHIVSDKSASR